MRRRLYALLAPLIVAQILSGCVQATRHSNALIFGTNTSLGIQVGTNATQIPSVVIGYNRQEAVVVPLVANVGEEAAKGNEPSRLKPCDLSQASAAALSQRFAVHPCSLVAVKDEAQDSYSVLASFGAQFDGGATATDAKARGGLAQYFATGVAAQILATTGGASVVAVGPAATASAIEAPSTANAIRALYGNDAAVDTGIKIGERFNTFLQSFQDRLASTPLDQIGPKVAAFESHIKPEDPVAALCTSLARCLAKARSNYFQDYTKDPAKDPDRFDAELKAW